MHTISFSTALKFFKASCAALLLSFIVVGCKPGGGEFKAGSTDGSDTNSPIKIGEFASLTGKEASFGESSHRGTEMAVEDLNAEGGVLGRKLKLIVEDTQSKSGESKTVVSKLITREKVVAVLGEVASSRSLEAAPICQKYKIPMISPSSTNPKVTESGDYIFRVCFLDPFQGKVLADFARKTLKADKVAILVEASSAYSVGLAKFFREPFEAAGGTIVAEQKFSGGDKDFKAQLTAIKAMGPQLIFVPCYYTEAGLVALQARELGITIPLIGGDGWESDKLLEIGGKAMEGTYYSTHLAPDSQDAQTRKFVSKYKQKHGTVPDSMAALGYDSVMILAEAIRKAQSAEPEKIREALAGIKDFTGATGTMSIDANRNAKKPAVILTIKEGQLKLVETIAAE